MTCHEQAASFIAATQGRLTGRPGVCLATLGPGALNLTTGAAYALLGGMPMIMITGQKGILSRKQGRFQVVDIVSTMAPLTKLARQSSARRPFPRPFAKPFDWRSRNDRGQCISSCRKISRQRRRPKFRS